LSRHFGPPLERGAGPHHHVEAARRWCRKDGAPERHLTLSGALFLELLLSLLISGPDLGAWPDCWVSVEFLHAPIPRKGMQTNIIEGRCLHFFFYGVFIAFTFSDRYQSAITSVQNEIFQLMNMINTKESVLPSSNLSEKQKILEGMINIFLIITQ